MINDQKAHWDNMHQAGKVNHSSVLGESTDFAFEVEKIIPPVSSILELGCGSGNDSFYFANKGHKVLATDFSDVVIAKNKHKYKHNNLTFKTLDISKSMPFVDNKFDAVYARLSLHYFTDKVTKKIFREIHRILKPKGYLCFLCKSNKDTLYGQGKKIEMDMFECNGHIRHFFSEDYTRECLGEFFNIQKLESGEDNFYGKPSAFVKTTAKKLII